MKKRTKLREAASVARGLIQEAAHEAEHTLSIASKKAEKQLADRVGRHEVALFGDGIENKGLVIEVHEMYEIFNGTKLVGKVLLGIIITAGAVAVAFTQVGRFLAAFFTKQIQ